MTCSKLFLFYFKRFMESELDLHDEVQRLHILATVPEHYPIIVKLHATNTLLGLITHENSGMIFFILYVAKHCQEKILDLKSHWVFLSLLCLVIIAEEIDQLCFYT